MVVEGNLPQDENGHNDSSEPTEEMLREEQNEPAALTDTPTAGFTEETDEKDTEREIAGKDREKIPNNNPTKATPPVSEIVGETGISPSEKSYAQVQEEVQAILGFNPDLPVLMPGRTSLTPEDKERINKYRKFQKVDGAAYRRVNQFLRKHTYVTAREWAIARLCADFTTRGGAEMTFIGENLPELVPFMTDTYSPQAVNQARSSFKRKVRKSGATFFYGALCGFFTADELDDILFESSEVARFLLEVEGTSIDIDDEIDIEDRITEVMREVAEAASMIRNRESVKNDEEEEDENEEDEDEDEMSIDGEAI
ncbi:DUF5806 family protein [Methanogenium sp. S4BF]|uniref:DUF5806 family protein n=1 Tax=Methanogenium sp. S4BF TaxID=1789226 RepID=UPI002415ABE8|nr:DUF5806 family protein [Methanogenium sp. S4BF]WFN34705.1 DUF5806 family protein [Methanogenium sp. S4BF]